MNLDTAPSSSLPVYGALRSKGVTLRDLRDEDAPVLAELWQDLEIQSLASRSIVHPRRSLQYAEDVLAEARQPITPTSTVHFAVTRNDDPESKAIGHVMLGDLNGLHRSGHIGIWLVESARGLGAGTEALQCMLYFAFEVRNLHRLETGAKALNTASTKMLTKAGFRQEGLKRSAVWHLGRFVDVSWFGILDEDYFSKRALAIYSGAA